LSENNEKMEIDSYSFGKSFLGKDNKAEALSQMLNICFSMINDIN
jgi:hypothetical protein